MYSHTNAPLSMQPASNLPHPLSQYSCSSGARLRHPGASSMPSYSHYSAPAINSKPNGGFAPRDDVAAKPKLPSFREAFPDHCHSGSSPQLKVISWGSPRFQMRRNSPSPLTIYSEVYNSRPSTAFVPRQPMSPGYVYPPQSRANDMLPPLLRPRASLTMMNRTRTPPVSHRVVHLPAAGREHMHFSHSGPAQARTILPAPEIAPPPQHVLQSSSDNSRPTPNQQFIEKRRPVLRPIQRLPAASTSEWEQFVRESRDENGEPTLQCIWDLDGGHSCLYQAEKQAMKRHIEVTHMRIKPHKCPFCEKRFGQKTAMKVHRATHTGETPLECKFKCGRHFSDPARRFRHYTMDHNYVPRKRHNKNRKRAKLAKEARAVAAIDSPSSSE